MNKAINKPVALVTGANGQDGSYLARKLQEQGWAVHGTARQEEARQVVADSLEQYWPLDLSDASGFHALLQRVRPAATFHTAAVHGPSGFSYEPRWQAVHEVNTVAAHAALEYCREGRGSSFFHFSSSKVFDLQGTISEQTPRQAKCIYSITKQAGSALVEYYRKLHGVRASTIWLFNHDSPRRGPDFFVPRLAQLLREAKAGGTPTTGLASANFWCDWGHAEEYMGILARHADKLAGEDYVLATGETVWARDMATDLFAKHGLDAAAYLPREASTREDFTHWQADISKLAASTGERPRLRAQDVCEEILSEPARAPA